MAALHFLSTATDAEINGMTLPMLRIYLRLRGVDSGRRNRTALQAAARSCSAKATSRVDRFTSLDEVARARIGLLALTETRHGDGARAKKLYRRGLNFRETALHEAVTAAQAAEEAATASLEGDDHSSDGSNDEESESNDDYEANDGNDDEESSSDDDEESSSDDETNDEALSTAAPAAGGARVKRKRAALTKTQKTTKNTGKTMRKKKQKAAAPAGKRIINEPSAAMVAPPPLPFTTPSPSSTPATRQAPESAPRTSPAMQQAPVAATTVNRNSVYNRVPQYVAVLDPMGLAEVALDAGLEMFTTPIWTWDSNEFDKWPHMPRVMPPGFVTARQFIEYYTKMLWNSGGAGVPDALRWMFDTVMKEFFPRHSKARHRWTPCQFYLLLMAEDIRGHGFFIAANSTGIWNTAVHIAEAYYSKQRNDRAQQRGSSETPPMPAPRPQAAAAVSYYQAGTHAGGGAGGGAGVQAPLLPQPRGRGRGRGRGRPRGPRYPN